LSAFFLRQDKEGEVHQCACGDIFYLGKSVKDEVSRDWLGNPKCPRCADSPAGYKDREWRRKFAIFVNITNALRRFEESEGNQKMKWLKEVRRLSKEFFHFRTVSEMYVGYYKLLKEVQGEETMPSSLKVEWKKLLESLFERAKKENLVEFIKFVFSPDPFRIRQIHDTIRESQTAIARMEKDYFLSKVSDCPPLVYPVTVEKVKISRIRFSLLLYSHLIELSPLYDLTMNLIRVSEGKEFAKEPIPKSVRFPSGKVAKINRANPEVGAIFKEFWVREVRNAFAHSKYKIEEDFFIKTDEDFKISIPQLQAKINLCKDYWGYLETKIAEEQIFAQENKVLHAKNDAVIKFSSETIPDSY
jgi:hypothetical protein